MSYFVRGQANHIRLTCSILAFQTQASDHHDRVGIHDQMSQEDQSHTMPSNPRDHAHLDQQPTAQDSSLSSASLTSTANLSRLTSPIPSLVLTVAGPHVSLHPIWHNPHTNTTTYLTSDDRVIEHHQPLQPFDPTTSTSTSLLNEAARSRWVATYLPNHVPAVLDVRSSYSTSPTATYLLLMTLLPGNPTSHPSHSSHPASAIHALGQALRHLHTSLPPSSCPWRFDVRTRIQEATARGLAVPTSLHEPPFDVPAPGDELVVCHGDACCPNVLLAASRDDKDKDRVDGDENEKATDDDDERPTYHYGYVDLGQLGVGDRWADLAVLAWSVEMNFEPGWEGVLLEGYGVQKDGARMEYYRALYEAT